MVSMPIAQPRSAATTATKTARKVYSLRRNAIAPLWIWSDRSTIISFPLSCPLT